jgi:hypothetical protein
MILLKKINPNNFLSGFVKFILVEIRISKPLSIQIRHR